MRTVHLPPTGLTTARWMAEVAPQMVPLSRLIPTQDHVSEEVVLRKQFAITESWIGDPWPHVVVLDDVWYIEDGHHRIEAMRRLGHEQVPARVFFYP